MMLAPVVTQYLKKGRVCVPLNNNSKEPFIKDYLNKTFSIEEFKTNSFGTNLEKSNECFVDCDSEYASRLVASFFPITETTKVGTRKANKQKNKQTKNRLFSSLVKLNCS